MVKMKQIIAVLFCVFTCIVSQSGTDLEPKDSSETSLKNQGKYEEYPTCTIDDGIDDGKKGICVPYHWCRGTQVWPGGYFDESTGFRESSDSCPGTYDSCCSTELIDENEPIPEDTDKCLLLDSDICPWCVKLYKTKTSDIANQPSSRAFCVGALIGSHVVLTSASCLVAARRYSVYARVPLSNDPDKNYVVKFSNFSPDYNQGTHYYDFGILLLEEQVQWGNYIGGACLRFSEPGGNCMTLGYNNNDNFVTTLIEVTKGGCSEMGGSGSPEIYCGISTEEQCFAQPGAPVVCQVDDGIVLLGVTRTVCINDQVAFGAIGDTKTTQWLRDSFKTLNVSEVAFIPN